MRIIADLVVNHTSDQCGWFKQAESNPESIYHDYYVWSDTDQKYKDARIIFVDTEKSNWTWNEKAGKYFWHRFYASQPDLNYDNPLVRQEMKSIMRFWLDLGIDGFRTDAVPYLIEREGTNCENLPETHDYLKELRALMDEEYPDCILLAEANQWPQDLHAYFADGDEFQLAFHFPLMPRIFKALALGDSQPIIEILENTPKIPPTCQWCTFLRNHDELTLEMVTEQERQFLWDFYAPEKRMRLNLGIRRRLAPLLNGDKHKIELLYTLLFSLPGTPIIYFGDEIGMGDNIWLNDRDGVRTPMHWTSGLNAGFSNRSDKNIYLPVIEQGQYSCKIINVENQLNDPDSLFNQMRKLIKVRREHKAFFEQQAEFLKIDNPAVLAVKRSNLSEEILCLHNLSPNNQSISLPKNDYSIIHFSENQAIDQIRLKDHFLTLNPYAFAWLSMKKPNK